MMFCPDRSWSISSERGLDGVLAVRPLPRVESLMTNDLIVDNQVVHYGPANKLAKKQQQDSFVVISSNPDINVVKP